MNHKPQISKTRNIHKPGVHNSQVSQDEETSLAATFELFEILQMHLNKQPLHDTPK